MLKNEEKWRKILEITIKAEVHIEDLEQVAISKDKANTILKYSKDERMEKTNVNLTEDKKTEVANMNSVEDKESYVDLIELANYLIQLFYQSGKRFSCTRTKIGKLLTILAFEYALQDRMLFNECIYKYDKCGTAIEKIMKSFDQNIYPQYGNDDRTFYSGEFDLQLTEDEYNDYVSITSDIRNAVEKVFRHFGSFTSTQLGECLNPIVNTPGVINANGEVELKKIKELELSNIVNLNSDNNEIVRYLFN